jgi:hypothetical protein
MAKTDFDKITRFDKGIRSSKRLNSDGEFSMVKNFDIFSDPFKAIPVKGWASEVTEAEKSYELRSVEYDSDEKLKACGYAVSNWYNPSWDYKVEVTSPATEAPDVKYFDLSLMPSTFWSNVESDGVDIRVTNTSDDEVDFYLGNFDTVSETGYILTKTSDFHIYYGNSSATQTQYRDSSTILDTLSSSLKVALWLENSTESSGTATLDLDNGTPTFGAGTETEFALTDGDISSNNFTISNNDDWYMVCNFKTGGSLVSSQDIMSVSSMSIGLNGSDQIQATFRTTGGTRTVTDTSTTVAINTEYFVVVTGNRTAGDYYTRLYVDGTLQDTDTDVSDSEDWSINPFQIDSNSSGCDVDSIYFAEGSTPSDTVVSAIYDMWKDGGSYWTVGSQTAYSSITPTYDKFAIWQKDIGGSGWEIISDFGGNAVIRDRYATNAGFIPNIFVTSNLDDNATGVYNMGGFDSFAPIDGALETSIFANEVNFPLIMRAEDKNIYMTDGADVYEVSETASTEATQNFISNISSMSRYINSIATISTYFDNAWVEYWDMDDNQSSGIFDAGRGEGRVIANVGGTLVAVINNFLDNDDKKGEEQSMDIRILDGGLAFKNFITITSPASMESYFSETWENPILQHTAQADSSTTFFWAKIPADATPTAYHEGLWALAKNKISNEFSLSLYVDTADQGDLQYLSSIGNIPYIIHSKDGSVESQTGTYDRTSVIETKIFNGGDSDVKKKLMGVEITHDPLESGQEIKVYYKKDEETSWTLIGSNTIDDSLSKEFLNIVSSGDGLPIYKEIEYKFESTGGSSALTGFKAKYQMLDNHYA